MVYIGFDTEYFNSNEEKMKVVAAVLTYPKLTERFNLLDPVDVEKLKTSLYVIQQERDILVAHSVGSESRSLISLGYSPLDFKWIDTYVEFIMLCNSNERFKYGDYIGSGGGIHYSVPPSPSEVEDDKDHTETPKGLVAAVFKMLNVRLDQEEKDTMRDLILSKDLKLIQENMDDIIRYCESDTKHLVPLLEAINRAFVEEGLADFEVDQLSRGRYAAATGMCENLGIPINMKLLNKVIEKTPEILEVGKKEVNSFFNFFVPEIQRPPITRKNGNVFHYKVTPAHKDMGAYQKYIESLSIPNFPKTETGKYKSDKDTLEEWGYWKGLESLWKYNKAESSLKWFNKDNKNGFFERLGSDENVRPFYGPFGTQTGRNAAKAKTFPLAMSSWLRAIVAPKDGYSIIGCDFSQQEVYVAAILSGDRNLLQAYNSGDVYLAFAKQANLVPESATKSSHKLERNLCKSTVLGLQFGMGHAKLKTKLRLDSGQEVSDEKTNELIQAHKTVFKDYWKWVKELSEDYKKGNPLITNDGWVLFCDNLVMTSVRNFPVQANAASITRAAIVACWEKGLKVMCGLHDAIYVISQEVEKDTATLEKAMFEATEKILRETKTSMRIDTKVIEHGEIWMEEKGEKDWEKLKGFLL